MKKIFMLMTCVTMASILTSCIANNSNKYEITDDIDLYCGESEIFKSDFISHENTYKEYKVEDLQKVTISIGNCDFEVYPTSIQSSDIGNIKYFKSDDGNVIYQISDNQEYFSIQAQNGNSLEEFSFEELNEETLRSQVERFILRILPDEKLEKYTISLNTRIVVKNPDATWNEKKDYFYSANENNNETVLYYNCDYRIYNQTLKTSDCIIITCDGYGNIIGFEYNNSNVDWSTASFNREDIENRAKTYISSAISEDYTLTNCNFKSECIVYRESTFRVSLDCELTLKNNDSEIFTMCNIVITPQ